VIWLRNIGYWYVWQLDPIERLEGQFSYVFQNGDISELRLKTYTFSSREANGMIHFAASYRTSHPAQ
jgi:hypothetical protein